ncbi:thioredoxin family protein [Crateriforma conspicua]|uniref:YHS domain protein n=2 Tax=Crateriforma conspicua TaxID=2527996 RepID=A0A5C6FR05_9PLAN|nr:YHS domain protein [Crateriforma conspicua]
MCRLLTKHAAMTAIAMVVALAGSFAVAAESGIPWQSNLKQAHAEASRDGKLLLLHFYGDNCPWCDRLEAGAFQNGAVAAAITSKYVPVKIHVGKDPAIAKMFQVKSLPTDVVVTLKGEKLSHKVSPQDPRQYVAMLNTAAASAGPAAEPQTMMAASQPAPTPSPAPAATPEPAPVVSTVAGQTNNQFALPKAAIAPGGVQATAAGARTDAMTLDMPAQIAVPPTTNQPAAASPQTPAVPPAATDAEADVAAAAPAVAPSDDLPPLALEGYCAVSINEDYAWVEGKPEHGVLHLGRLYLFSSAENKQKFLADPKPYTPVMNEIDVVRFFEEKRIVPGKRDYGVKDPIHGRMFFFADQAARDHFENQFERYTDAAIEVMDQAIGDANP